MSQPPGALKKKPLTAQPTNRPARKPQTVINCHTLTSLYRRLNLTWRSSTSTSKYHHSSLSCVRKTENRDQSNYQPQHTLLEPNNFIPSWECGGEEIKEVSATMRKLRQQFDETRRQVQAKERELELVKKKLELV